MIDAPADTEVHVRSWRRMWLATSMDALKCPNGHRLRDPIVLDHGCIRCKYVDPAEEKRGRAMGCGKLVYVVAGLQTIRGSHVILCCEVDASDMRTMAERHMGIDDVVAYLGIVL